MIWIVQRYGVVVDGVVVVNELIFFLQGFYVPSMGEKIDPIQFFGSVSDLHFDGGD